MGKPYPEACPPVPPHRKAFGTAVNVDGEVLLYTAAEVAAHGLACFRAAQNFAETRSIADAIQGEEDTWSDYRSGRKSKPK